MGGAIRFIGICVDLRPVGMMPLKYIVSFIAHEAFEQPWVRPCEIYHQQSVDRIGKGFVHVKTDQLSVELQVVAQ